MLIREYFDELDEPEQLNSNCARARLCAIVGVTKTLGDVFNSSHTAAVSQA